MFQMLLERPAVVETDIEDQLQTSNLEAKVEALVQILSKSKKERQFLQVQSGNHNHFAFLTELDEVKEIFVGIM